MDPILKSVGRGGVNRDIDVKLIQQLLNAQSIPGETIPLVVDGIAGEKTYKYIDAFQREIVKMANPDGRVDPGGKTFKKLTATTTVDRDGVNPARTYTLSTKGGDLLKSIEKLALKPYDDQTGKDISDWVKGATIGYGHLIAKSDWEKYKGGFSETDANELFIADLSPFVNTVQAKVTAKIAQNEFDAMIFLIFNIGREGFSTSSALKLINDPNASTSYSHLEDAWKAWNKSNKVVNKGLINRRNAEWNIYSKNVYQRW